MKQQEDDSTHPSGSLIRGSGVDLGNKSDKLCDRILQSLKIRSSLDSTKFDPYPMNESSLRQRRKDIFSD